MKVGFHETYINLRAETKEERAMLKEMGDTGIVVWGRGSYTSISSKKYWDSVNDSPKQIKNGEKK